MQIWAMTPKGLIRVGKTRENWGHRYGAGRHQINGVAVEIRKADYRGGSAGKQRQALIAVIPRVLDVELLPRVVLTRAATQFIESWRNAQTNAATSKLQTKEDEARVQREAREERQRLARKTQRRIALEVLVLFFLVLGAIVFFHGRLMASVPEPPCQCDGEYCIEGVKLDGTPRLCRVGGKS